MMAALRERCPRREQPAKKHRSGVAQDQPEDEAQTSSDDPGSRDASPAASGERIPDQSDMGACPSDDAMLMHQCVRCHVPFRTEDLDPAVTGPFVGAPCPDCARSGILAPLVLLDETWDRDTDVWIARRPQDGLTIKANIGQLKKPKRPLYPAGMPNWQAVPAQDIRKAKDKSTKDGYKLDVVKDLLKH